MKIVILGGGISGLSAAWYLRKQLPNSSITLLEKEESFGGVIQTEERPVLFEKGPRVFPLAKSASLLSLIREVGLESEILLSSPLARQRYLWHQGKLSSLSSFWPQILWALLSDLVGKQESQEEESIASFARRRFGRRFTETLFDPLVLGIFAGNIEELSIRSCFPSLWEYERRYGSVIQGWFREKRGRSEKGFFTLRSGMGSLIKQMVTKVDAELISSCSVEQILPEGVVAGGRFFPADFVVSALPAPTLVQLAQSKSLFSSLSMWVVSSAFPPGSFDKKGIGHLIPTKEKESLLGVLWDSSLFPSQGEEVRLSALLRDQGDASWACQETKRALNRQLGINATPLFFQPHYVPSAIPQFSLGYQAKLFSLQEELKSRFPRLILIGNYLQNPSVDWCVNLASQIKIKN